MPEEAPHKFLVSPAERLCGIVEVIEAILYCLPIAKLLAFRGICKHWRSIISESPKLQTKLFLNLKVSEDPHAEPIIRYNPLLRSFKHRKKFPKSCLVVDIAYLYTWKDDHNSSWKDMHVFKPSVGYLNVWVLRYYGSREDWAWRKFIIENPDGVKLGAISALVASEITFDPANRPIAFDFRDVTGVTLMDGPKQDGNGAWEIDSDDSSLTTSTMYEWSDDEGLSQQIDKLWCDQDDEESGVVFTRFGKICIESD